jgi:hypothetical protein
MRIPLIGLALALCACSGEAGPPEAQAASEGLRGREETASGCLAENAVYALRSANGPELSFIDNLQTDREGDLVVRVRAHGATHWFWLNQGSDFGAVMAARGPDPTDPYEEPATWEARGADITTFTLFTEQFDVIDRAPKTGDAAPAHIFAPDMGAALIGHAPRREDGAVSILPVAMWDFARCESAE